MLYILLLAASLNKHLNKIIVFLDINHRLLFIKKCFRGWFCLRSQVKSPLSWIQSIELVPISGHQDQRKTIYVNPDTT
jgi:hypothetical protein